MLTLLHHTTDVHQCQFSLLEALLEEPFPQTPHDLWQLEQRLSAAATQVADQIVLVQLMRAHEAEAFVTQAIAHARAQSPVPLVHKGFRTTSVLLLGGTRLILETPYLREDRRGHRGRRRRTRGPHGAGCYPVLEALGIADRVSPATRSEIALHRRGADNVGMKDVSEVYVDIDEEHASGAHATRPEVAAALRACRAGDNLVVWKLDRGGRSMKHLVEIGEDLLPRGSGVQVLTGVHVDTSTPHGMFGLPLFAARAEYERALLKERVGAGRAATRARGRTGGRRPKLSSKRYQLVADMAQGGMPLTTVASTLQGSRHTVYQALALVSVAGK